MIPSRLLETKTGVRGNSGVHLQPRVHRLIKLNNTELAVDLTSLGQFVTRLWDHGLGAEIVKLDQEAAYIHVQARQEKLNWTEYDISHCKEEQQYMTASQLLLLFNFFTLMFNIGTKI